MPKLGDIFKTKDDSGREPLLRKKLTRKLSSIVPPPPPASKVRKVKDDAGHEHGEGGRFVTQGQSHSKAMSALQQHYGGQGNASHDPEGTTQGTGRGAPDAGMDDATRSHVHGLLSQVGSFLSGKRKTPKQRIEDAHTDPKTGAVDYDASVAERSEHGHLEQPTTMGSTAVFNMGGGGVGKGSMTAKLVGNGGSRDSLNNVIGPGHPEYKAPQPGFSPERVFDSDAEKKKMPLYSDTAGQKRDHSAAPDATMYGPSGPRTGAELAKYTPEEQEAMHAYVRKTTKFKDAHDFARSTITGPRNPKAAAAGDLSHGHFNDGTNKDTEFDGGLTHELSSHIVKAKLMHALAHPEEGSFVYDSVGNEKYKAWAQEARDNGFRSEFHEAVLHAPTDKKTGAGLEIASPEVAQYRNQGRERTVDPALLAETHEKAARISPILNEHSRELLASGANHDHVHHPTMSDEDVSEAVNAGMTAKGPSSSTFEHPKKKEKRLEREAKARVKSFDPFGSKPTGAADRVYGKNERDSNHGGSRE